jgi:hypothetical protein
MCYLCKKWAYSLVLWDTKLASNASIFKSVKNTSLANLKPAIAPVAVSIDSIKEVLPLISVTAFLKRLRENRNGIEQRNINDVEEKERLK